MWKIDKENCCINEILEEILAEYYSIFKKKNIVPEINICNEMIYKNLNKNSLIRIFENILSNMIKYSDGNFKIKLERSGKIIFSNQSKKIRYNNCTKNFWQVFYSRKCKQCNRSRALDS